MKTYNSDKHHRKSIRLKGYDYSQSGMYYITICTQNRLPLFGQISDGKMILNDAGKMIVYWYGELLNKFPDIKHDRCIVMPNHVHFIINNICGGVDNANDVGIGDVVGADRCVCPDNNVCVCFDNNDHGIEGERDQNIKGERDQNIKGEHAGSPLRDIIQWFKTMTTNNYIRGVKKHDWMGFPGKLWQRNYYEHIVRNEKELNKIRQYIIDNPINWENDQLNDDLNIIMNHECCNIGA